MGPLRTLTAATLALLIAGCARSVVALPASTSIAHPTTAHTTTAPIAANSADYDVKTVTGLLVLHGDIVHMCSIEEATTEQPWKSVLSSLAACMSHGPLRSRHVVVRGAESARTVVGYVLAKMGIDEKRVKMSAATSVACWEGDCPAERTVDIALSPRDLERDGVSVVVDRRTIVAFLSEDNLE